MTRGAEQASHRDTWHERGLARHAAASRDECWVSKQKPAYEIPGPKADDPATLRQQATEWCERFRDNAEQWLKTTIAEHTADGPRLSYEPVDTSLIPPRPRTYGL